MSRKLRERPPRFRGNRPCLLAGCPSEISKNFTVSARHDFMKISAWMLRYLYLAQCVRTVCELGIKQEGYVTFKGQERG